MTTLIQNGTVVTTTGRHEADVLIDGTTIAAVIQPGSDADVSAAGGADRVIAAVDSKGGRVVIRGWTEPVTVTAVEAVRVLEPYCGEFLYTHVDREGLMAGTDMEAVRQVAAATTRRVTAAGGITTRAEIDTLDDEGIDAVVGMAIYTGTLTLDPEP